MLSLKIFNLDRRNRKAWWLKWGLLKHGIQHSGKDSNVTERGNDRTILKGLEKVVQCPGQIKMLLHLLREMVMEGGGAEKRGGRRGRGGGGRG